MKTGKKHFFVVLGVFVVAAVGVVVGVHVQYVEAIASQQNVNQYMEKEITILDKKIEEIEGLQQIKERLLARMEVIQKLQSNRPAVVLLFNEMVHVIPDGLYITRVDRLDNVISLEGGAESNTRVSKLMRNMEISPSFFKPTLNVIEAEK